MMLRVVGWWWGGWSGDWVVARWMGWGWCGRGVMVAALDAAAAAAAGSCGAARPVDSGAMLRLLRRRCGAGAIGVGRFGCGGICGGWWDGDGLMAAGVVAMVRRWRRFRHASQQARPDAAAALRRMSLRFALSMARGPPCLPRTRPAATPDPSSANSHVSLAGLTTLGRRAPRTSLGPS